MHKIINKISSGFKYSIEGLKFLIKDPSWQIEFVVALITMPIIILLDVSYIDKILLFSSIILVLITEALNAGIEAAIDRTSLEIHPLAKKAKDVASAAVFLAICNAAVIWTVIILSKVNM